MDLLTLIRTGNYAGTLDWLVAAGPAERARACVEVCRLRRTLADEAEGAIGEAWEGELMEHYDAATLAHLACLPPDRAARETTVGVVVAEDLPLVHAGDLATFVRTWSELYQRNPRNVDRNACYKAMFHWVERGLVPAPLLDGAVNLWITLAAENARPTAEPGPGEPAPWRIPTVRTCPELWTMTLPRLFEAQVGKGHGAAAYDVTAGPVVHGLVVSLVRDGVWDGGMTLARLDRALALRERAMDRSWLRRLRTDLSG